MSLLRPRRLVLPAAGLFAMAAVVAGSVPAPAAVEPPGVTVPGAPDPAAYHAGIDPALRGVRVRSSEHDAAVADALATEATLGTERILEIAAAADQVRLADLAATLDAERVAAIARRDEARDRRDSAQRARQRLDDALVRTQREIQTVAISDYISAGASSDVVEDAGALNDARRRDLYAHQVLDSKLAFTADLTVARDEAQLRIEIAEADRAREEAERVRLNAEIEAAGAASAVAAAEEDRAQRRQRELTTVLDGLYQRVAEARRLAEVVDLDFTLVVLDAYHRAADALATTDPGCGLRWQVLAGIGRTESRHGTHGGASVGDDGTVAPPIIGPPLDGTRFALIVDTDGGRLDGDAEFDRAVGPMQFIPTSWALYGRDADGDGVADPNDLADAALAAGVLLCRTSDLRSEASLRRALFGYNQSNAYVDAVMDRTRVYDRFHIDDATS